MADYKSGKETAIRFLVGQVMKETKGRANPGLVKTMSVKPPTGTGRVRLVEIVGLDLQPCGGTHVARTDEIGRANVVGVEKKGRINRRVRIALETVDD